MPGYHPFMGRYPRLKEPPRIEQAISASLFPFGREAARRGAEPPKGSPLLSDLTAEVGGLFERAFSPAASRPGARPAADAWYAALARLEADLTVCPDDAGHCYPAALPGCPWCRIENAGGASFFLTVTLARDVGGPVHRFDLVAAWARISAVPPPRLPAGYPAAIRAPSPTPLPPVVDDQRRVRRVVGVVAILAAGLILVPGGAPFGLALAAVFGAWWFGLYLASPLRKEQAARRAAASAAAGALKAAVAGRDRLGQEARRRFDAGLDALKAARRRYEELPAERDREWRKLQEHSRDRQLKEYLERHVIWHANVPNVGPKRAATLAGYGIETAADVEPRRVMAVPGFGPGLTGELLVWRQRLEAAFEYDAARGVPKADRDAHELRFRKDALQLERALTRGEAGLASVNAEFDRRLAEANAAIAEARAAADQAEADLKVSLSHRPEAPLPVRLVVLMLLAEAVVVAALLAWRFSGSGPPQTTGSTATAEPATAEPASVEPGAPPGVGTVASRSVAPTALARAAAARHGRLTVTEVRQAYESVWQRAPGFREGAINFDLVSETAVYDVSSEGTGVWSFKTVPAERQVRERGPRPDRLQRLTLMTGPGDDVSLVDFSQGGMYRRIPVKRVRYGRGVPLTLGIDAAAEAEGAEAGERRRSEEMAEGLSTELAARLGVPPADCRVAVVRTETTPGSYEDLVPDRRLLVRAAEPRTVTRTFEATVTGRAPP